MFKEKFLKLKESLDTESNSKKKLENLVVLILVIIITIVAINYIWTDNNYIKEKNITDSNKKLAEENNYEEDNHTSKVATNSHNIEEKLEDILSNINGVGNVKVLITYSQTNTVIPMYDEDSSSTLTEESDGSGGTRVTNQTSSKKDIIYEETENGKNPITQSIINAKIEGAIVTASGASNSEVKESIIQAVEAITGLATHKIQVFEMQ